MLLNLLCTGKTWVVVETSLQDHKRHNRETKKKLWNTSDIQKHPETRNSDPNSPPHRGQRGPPAWSHSNSGSSGRPCEYSLRCSSPPVTGDPARQQLFQWVHSTIFTGETTSVFSLHVWKFSIFVWKFSIHVCLSLNLRDSSEILSISSHVIDLLIINLIICQMFLHLFLIWTSYFGHFDTFTYTILQCLCFVLVLYWWKPEYLTCCSLLMAKHALETENCTMNTRNRMIMYWRHLSRSKFPHNIHTILPVIKPRSISRIQVDTGA